jgi:type I restriction enzyme, S subunit
VTRCWICVPLGEVTSKIGSGATPLGGEAAYQADGVSLIRSLNVHDGEFRRKDLAFLSVAQANGLANVVVQPNDVLLNITGASVARCCSVPDDVLPARVNQHVAIIRPKPERLSPRFLQYLLVSAAYKDRLLGAGEAAGATRQALTKAQLQALLVKFPASLLEQARIVAILDEAFEAIATAKANAEKNLKNARELFETYLGLVFASQGEVVPLSKCAADISDGDHAPPPKSQTGIPFITISNVDKESRRIDFSNTFTVPRAYFEALKPHRKPKRGDVLYTVTGSFGIPVLVEDDTEFCFQRHIGLIRPNADVNSRWLMYALLSPQVRMQAEAGATGTAQRTVSLGVLRAITVPKIGVDVQSRIATQVDSVNYEVGRLKGIARARLAALEELKNSLLHQAFSGAL